MWNLIPRIHFVSAGQATLRHLLQASTGLSHQKEKEIGLFSPHPPFGHLLQRRRKLVFLLFVIGVNASALI